MKVKLRGRKGGESVQKTFSVTALPLGYIEVIRFTADQPRGLNFSILVGTRKIANYSSIG